MAETINHDRRWLLSAGAALIAAARAGRALAAGLERGQLNWLGSDSQT